MSQGEDVFSLARQCRGRVPELNNGYIEKYIPEPVLSTIRSYGATDHVDDHGFWWSTVRVRASKRCDDGRVVVVLASKPLGQGVHELRVVYTDGEFATISSEELIS